MRMTKKMRIAVDKPLMKKFTTSWLGVIASNPKTYGRERSNYAKYLIRQRMLYKKVKTKSRKARFTFFPRVDI